MDEKSLQKISLIIVLIGILSLFIIIKFLSPKDLDISNINKNNIQDTIRINGYIESIQNKDSLYIIKVVQNNKSIDIIVYDRIKIDLNKGDLIEVTGKLTEYKNKLQIEVDSIKKYDS